MLERHGHDESPRTGQRRAASSTAAPIRTTRLAAAYARGELDLVAVRYTPRLADLVPARARATRSSGPAAGRAISRSTTTHPVTSNLELRRALAHAIDRERSRPRCPATWSSRPAASCRRRCRATRRTSRCASTRTSRGSICARAGARRRPLRSPSRCWEPVARGARRAAGASARARVEIACGRWRRWRSSGGRGRRRRSSSPAGCPATPTPSTTCGCCSSPTPTNEGGFAYPPFDELIERARQERSDRERLELFHEADRMAVAEQVALIPLVYGRSMAFVKPRVHGWWEFGKSRRRSPTW